MQSSDTLFNHLICCVGVSWQLLIITQLDVMDRGLHFCVVDSGLMQGGARGGSVGISRSYALQIACPVKYFPGNDDERPSREFVCFDI